MSSCDRDSKQEMKCVGWYQVPWRGIKSGKGSVRAPDTREDRKEAGRLGGEVFAYLREEHPGRRKSRCEELGVRAHLACLGTKKKARVTGPEGGRGEGPERKSER